MAEQVIIDGNNLLYAMYAHAPLPHIGRETLVKIVERWASQGDDDVTLVFDGPVPREGFARQMTSRRITVRFSAPVSADDVIVALLHRAKDPGRIRVVTGDRAIRREARYRRCRHSEAAAFVAELFPQTDVAREAPSVPRDKPKSLTPDETREWLEHFGYGDSDDEPFDGYGAMAE